MPLTRSELSQRQMMLHFDPETIFSMRESASIPYMVKRGECAIVAGVWQAGTISKYSEIVGKSGKVVFIEANPASIERLQKITKNMPWVIWVNKALWSEKAILPFTVNDEGRGSWDRLRHEKIKMPFPHSFTTVWHDIDIQADTLDNILAELNIDKVDHLNMTINMAELEALKGAEKTLADNPNMRIYAASSGLLCEDVAAFLETKGYTVWYGRKAEGQITGEKKPGNIYRVYAKRQGKV